MKIEQLLTEKFATSSFSALTPFHIATLKRIADGRLDPFGEISEKTQAYLDELVNLGFLDPAYGLSDTGERAINIANKIGTQDLRDVKRKAAARRMANAKDAPVQVDVDVEDDDEDEYGGEDVDQDVDVDLGGTLTQPKKKVKRDRVAPLRSTDFETLDGKEDFIDNEFDWEE